MKAFVEWLEARLCKMGLHKTYLLVRVSRPVEFVIRRGDFFSHDEDCSFTVSEECARGCGWARQLPNDKATPINALVSTSGVREE